MKKKSTYRCQALPAFFFMIIALLIFGGCSNIGDDTEKPQDKVTKGIVVKDDLNRTIELPDIPRKIVSISPANTEILYALGLGNSIVGVTDFCDFPEEAKSKPKVGGFTNPNIEMIVTYNPDIVLGTTMQSGLIADFDRVGIKFAAIDAKNLNEVLEDIRWVGTLTGTEEKALEITASLEKRIQKITDVTKSLSQEQKPTVLFEFWSEPISTGGNKSFIHNIIETAGGRNIAGDIDKDWVDMNPESVISRNPEVIIFTHHSNTGQNVEQIKNRPGWNNVSACMNDKVYLLPDENIVLRTGPRIVDGLELVFSILHPDKFKK